MPPKDQESEPKDSSRTRTRIEKKLELATSEELIELLQEISKKIRKASVTKKK